MTWGAIFARPYDKGVGLVFFEDQAGCRTKVDELHPGQTIGEMSMLRGEAREVTVIASPPGMEVGPHRYCSPHFFNFLIEPQGVPHGELKQPSPQFQRTVLSLSRFMAVSRGILI
jgi:hypothetical protein